MMLYEDKECDCMAKLINIPYKGKALETYDRIMGDLSPYQYNTVYKHIESGISPIYFYINTKNYMHILRVIRNPYYRGKFQISDYMLSVKDTLIDKGCIEGVFSTVEDAYKALELLINKNKNEGFYLVARGE